MKFTAADVQSRMDSIIYKNADAIAGGAQAHAGRTPLDELLSKEAGSADGDEGSAVDMEYARQEIFHGLLGFFFADGCEPINVVRRVYSVVKAVRPDLIGDMSLEDMAVLLADGGRATVSARIKRVYNCLLDDNSEHSGKSRAWFQKSETARAAYQAVQQGNSNRSKGRRKKG